MKHSFVQSVWQNSQLVFLRIIRRNITVSAHLALLSHLPASVHIFIANHSSLFCFRLFVVIAVGFIAFYFILFCLILILCCIIVLDFTYLSPEAFSFRFKHVKHFASKTKLQSQQQDFVYNKDFLTNTHCSCTMSWRAGLDPCCWQVVNKYSIFTVSKIPKTQQLKIIHPVWQNFLAVRLVQITTSHWNSPLRAVLMSLFSLG